MIGRVASVARSGTQQRTPADPDRGEKWETDAPASSIVPKQIVITAVHDEHVSYRRMSDNGTGSMTLEELRTEWRFVETVPFDDNDDWTLP